MTRRCACGNLTRVRDYDEPAICEDCQDETTRDIEAARATNLQAGAQFVGRMRGTRDDVGAR